MSPIEDAKNNREIKIMGIKRIVWSDKGNLNISSKKAFSDDIRNTEKDITDTDL